MCRLFGMSGGLEPVKATFWLLEAPDSLALQSRMEPDGTGLGAFTPAGEPLVFKQPLAAFEDQQFAYEAHEVSSQRTFVAHVRYASNGPVTLRNTHPFEQHGRLFAHNGVIGGLDQLERELGDDRSLVSGDTDSERFFALITREIDATGEIGAGIVSAATWAAEHLPVLSLNFILITETQLWALRYPDTHELHVLEREPGGTSGRRHLEHASARGSIRVRSGELIDRPAVLVATERMDEDGGWRSLQSGELLHVGADLQVQITRPLNRPPAHPLSLSDLDRKAAASQGVPA
jgi:predicted glutamine amidotransferase